MATEFDPESVTGGTNTSIVEGSLKLCVMDVMPAGGAGDYVLRPKNMTRVIGMVGGCYADATGGATVRHGLTTLAAEPDPDATTVTLGGVGAGLVLAFGY